MALLAIKSMIKDDPQGLMTSWNDSNTNFCQWESVACSRRHQRVTVLDLSSGGLTGTLSPSIGNLSFLREIHLVNNSFFGEIPPEIGRLFRLRVLRLQNNSFTGNIPATITNCSNLQVLHLGINLLVGGIPPFIANLTLLETLSFGDCQLGGHFPDVFHRLTNLRRLAFAGNNLVGTIPPSLYNCSSLEEVYLDNNTLTGRLPSNLGYTMPRIVVFSLFLNRLTGPLPPSILGSIPGSLGNLSLVLELYLTSNKFTGTIPSSLGNCKQLLRLNLDQNNLTGDIPRQLFEISSLSISLNLGFNQLSGQLPIEIGNLKNLNEVILANNRLSGSVPNSLGSCSSLQILDISYNLFSGAFPSSLGSLRALENLDASHNNFTGGIPAYLEVLALRNLNISFNDLEGEVSRKGVFANASSISILGNRRLCGGVPELKLPKCQSNKKKNKLSLAVILVISVGSVLFFVVMVLSYACYPWKKKVEDGPQKSTSWEYLSQVSYNTLYNATDGFSTENLIGEGSFSSVYKGCLDTDGVNIVAIKVLNLHHRGGSKSFISECDALRNTRHRNLAKVITCCSGIDFQGNDFKAIVYEFMPNGSLDKWLHNPQSELHQLSLIQRVCIVLDVAYALDYLHHHAGQTIVHCDLKPSNILLDEDMVAHLGDFGLSKILQSEYQHRYNTSSAGVRGTIGYAAPEYGVGSKVSKNADMYSFGIMLLEMMTRKKPTGVMFGEELSLHSYAENAMGDGAMEIIDPVLLKDDQKIGLTTNKEETTVVAGNRRVMFHGIAT
ncbi:hypothetical protein M8C21_024570 [Ambrosia artemisiifolia]|uniref:non-specific serine/threonine protein kinase n=1 Tax=Ambrosia artemisiifolia TaxID=4212 RepID=A0AAD5G501_AMBAR|nr:hypothetical protein M8C21_024570 [Ambrosia artemisiifolia]